MFKVDEDKRPDYSVAIPWYVVDCFDFVEYVAFDQMLYYVDRYNYDIIQNPHVKVDGNKTTFVTHPLVRYSSTFKSNKKKDLYPEQKINSENRQLPLDQYRGMTQNERDIVIKSLYVDIGERNIFIVLRNLHTEMREQKAELQNKEFSYNDEDVRCKFSVVYTEFRLRHPKLYGNIDRSTLNHSIDYMFNKFTDDEDSYYLKYIYRPDKNVYGYIKKSPLTDNYQYYECDIDKQIQLDFTKGKNYNEEVLSNWYHTYTFLSEKLKKRMVEISRNDSLFRDYLWKIFKRFCSNV
jgi:hypothetical protein